jgi:hypothetical protein
VALGGGGTELVAVVALAVGILVLAAATKTTTSWVRAWSAAAWRR